MAIRVSTSLLTDASASIQISNRSVLGIAPEQIFFEPILSGFHATGPAEGEKYDPRFHDIFYRWDYYAAGSDSDESYTYQHLSKVPSQFRDSRYSFGPNGSHVYRKPGTYRVEVYCYEPASGKSATATLDVIINDPNTVFVAPTQTLIVDTGADTAWRDANYPGSSIYTDMASAIAAVKGYGNDSTPRRIIARRGQSSTWSPSAFGNHHARKWPSVHILAANEAGAKPIFHTSGASNYWDDIQTTQGVFGKDLVFQNIECRGGWDATTETGDAQVFLDVHRNPPGTILLDDVILNGYSIFVYGGPSSEGLLRLNVNDCHFENFATYGFLIQGSDYLAFTGSKLIQTPQAFAGGIQDGTHNNGGPVRMPKPKNEIIHSCEFYSRCDWIANSDPTPIWGQAPAVRYDTSGGGVARSNIQCNVIEGGNNIMSMGVQAGNYSNRRLNILIEKNYFLATHSTRIGVVANKPGTTIRNNVMTFPDTPQYNNFGASLAFKGAADLEIAGEENEPIRIYNNTIINLLPTEITLTQFTGFPDYEEANNVLYQPNIGTPQTADGPLNTTPLFAPFEPGYRAAEIPILQTAYATPHSSVWTGTLQAGSAAIGDALNAPAAFDDFYGNPGHNILRAGPLNPRHKQFCIVGSAIPLLIRHGSA